MTRRCAMRWPRVADCACSGRIRGNVSRRSFCPRPNRSFKSGKSSPCSANGSANRSPDRQPPGNAGVSPARSITISQFVRRRDASAPRTPSPRPAGRGTGRGARHIRKKIIYSIPFPLPNGSPTSPKPSFARAKWVFARRICSPPRARLPMANSIWNVCAICRWRKHAGN